MPIPPYTDVVTASISRTTRSRCRTATEPCALCARRQFYLDEVMLDDRGGRMFVCSDTDHCGTRRASGHVGRVAGRQKKGREKRGTEQGKEPKRKEAADDQTRSTPLSTAAARRKPLVEIFLRRVARAAARM